MAKNILIKPVITEKTDKMTKRGNQYCFVVSKDANKIEIKEAVEEMYGIEPTAVNTVVVPGKTRTRYRGRVVMRGMKPAYKKAYVTLPEGDSIDFYGTGDED